MNRYLVFLLFLFIFFTPTILFSIDCYIIDVNGKEMHCQSCYWDGDRLVFQYNGKGYVYDKIYIKECFPIYKGETIPVGSPGPPSNPDKFITKKSPDEIGNGSERNSSNNAVECDGFSDDINKLKESGFLVDIKYDHSFYVSKMWYVFTLDKKEAAAWGFAKYCECKTGDGFASVYDAYTGKELCKYSLTWGFSNYEDE